MRRVTGHVKTVDRKRGPVFYLKYRLADGRQVQKLLGPKWTGKGRPADGFYTDRTAADALNAVLTDARRGTLEGASLRTGRTFHDACAEWLRYVEHDREREISTVRDYRNVVNGYLLGEFGESSPLEKVTTARVEAFRDRMLDEGRLSRRTIEKVMVILHGVLKHAKRKGWITTNPAEDVERVHPKRSGDFNVLTPIEVQAVARAARSRQDGAIFLVAAFTGLRLGELRALRWGDVDFAGAMVHVRRNLPVHGEERVPKSGKVRSVPLIDQAARPLDMLSRREHFTGPHDRVFCTETGAAFNDGDVRREFYAALVRAGLGLKRYVQLPTEANPKGVKKADPIVLHDLRHSFGTLAVKVWELPKVQGYMGHADVQTTMIYVHHQPKTADAAALSGLVGSELAAGEGLPLGEVDDLRSSAARNL
jgi:integrase